MFFLKHGLRQALSSQQLPVKTISNPPSPESSQLYMCHKGPVLYWWDLVIEVLTSSAAARYRIGEREIVCVLLSSSGLNAKMT